MEPTTHSPPKLLNGIDENYKLQSSVWELKNEQCAAKLQYIDNNKMRTVVDLDDKWLVQHNMQPSRLWWGRVVGGSGSVFHGQNNPFLSMHMDLYHAGTWHRNLHFTPTLYIRAQGFTNASISPFSTVFNLSSKLAEINRKGNELDYTHIKQSRTSSRIMVEYLVLADGTQLLSD